MKAAKSWTATKYQGLYRHKSSIYYARIEIGGKETWRSLKTTVQEVAREKLDELRRDTAKQNELSREIEIDHPMKVEDAIAIRKRQLENGPSIKKSTRHYWNQLMVSLSREWPELAATEVRNVSIEQCRGWAGRFSKIASPTRYNNSLSLLKQLFDIGIERGARRANPAAKLKRVKVHSKDLSERLPSREQFASWVKTIREGHGRYSRHCGDFVELLAYTGMRKSEAAWVEWRHCNFERGEILVEGDPGEGTKNSESRRIPLIPAARELLLKMQKQQQDESPTERVLKVRESQKAMDHAGEKLGLPRITHHDLRHLFATICIESGIDIPTVSKWLGHKDGGALAMKVYGHLRNEHTLAAATRVSFAAR